MSNRTAPARTEDSSNRARYPLMYDGRAAGKHVSTSMPHAYWQLAAREFNLKPGPMQLLGTMLDAASDRDRIAHLKVPKIAEYMNIDERTVRTHIASLVEPGLVTKDKSDVVPNTTAFDTTPFLDRLYAAFLAGLDPGALANHQAAPGQITTPCPGESPALLFKSQSLVPTAYAVQAEQTKENLETFTSLFTAEVKRSREWFRGEYGKDADYEVLDGTALHHHIRRASGAYKTKLRVEPSGDDVAAITLVRAQEINGTLRGEEAMQSQAEENAAMLARARRPRSH